MGINGFVLAESLRELLPSLRVLFTSGYSEDIMANRRVCNAAIELIEKPYTIQSLSSRVREVLDIGKRQ